MESEFEISCSDITLIEAEWEFDSAKTIMDEDTFVDEWTLASDVTVLHPQGVAGFNLDLNSDKSVIITFYQPSMGDVLYNPDVPFLSAWLQEHGWDMPEPHPDLVRVHDHFWRHFWETSIIQSGYLDNKYGGREEQYED